MLTSHVSFLAYYYILHLKMLIMGWDRHLSNYRNLLTYTSNSYTNILQIIILNEINNLQFLITHILHITHQHINKNNNNKLMKLKNVSCMPPLYRLHPYSADRSHRLTHTHSPNRNSSNWLDCFKLTITWDVPCQRYRAQAWTMAPLLKERM